VKLQVKGWKHAQVLAHHVADFILKGFKKGMGL
jgi:hypothetical protein